jgi:hypothetical protein
MGRKYQNLTPCNDGNSFVRDQFFFHTFLTATAQFRLSVIEHLRKAVIWAAHHAPNRGIPLVSGSRSSQSLHRCRLATNQLIHVHNCFLDFEKFQPNDMVGCLSVQVP